VRIGVELGGPETDVLVLGDDGTTVRRERAPTATARYEDILETVKSLVTLVEVGATQRGTVGVSLPGAISAKTGRVKNSNNANLLGADLANDLNRLLERDVRIGNDANCFALAEATDGAAAGAGVVLGLILGAGVGAGITVGRRVVEGANAVAGEVGHNPLPWSSDEESSRVRCYCGRSGCIEQFLSLSGLQRAYKNRTGLYVSTDEILRHAGAKQSDAIACLTEYEDRLARVIGSLVNVLDPDSIVLGGALAKSAVDYATLPEAVARYAFSDRLDTKFVQAAHGDAAGVRGAAMLWPVEGSG
jgi:fructokinase